METFLLMSRRDRPTMYDALGPESPWVVPINVLVVTSPRPTVARGLTQPASSVAR